MEFSMPSLRSKFFISLLQVMNKLQPKSQRIDYFDYNTSITNLRLMAEKRAEFFGKLPKGFNLEQVMIDKLEAEWIIPANGSKKKVILYFHGGAYIIGSIKAHRGIVSKFVKASGISAMVFNYQLAPENPFPAGLNDSVNAYKYLLNIGIAPQDIVFIGDSAGGGLLLATILALKEKKINLPAGAVALSPWTDLTCSGDSITTKAELDKLSWKNSWHVCSDYYSGEEDPSNPLISPLFGDLTGFPPLQIYVGTNEVHLDDSVRFAKKARESGVEVKLTVGEGLFHCYPACAPMFPEATKAMKNIGDFVKIILAK